MAAAKKMNEKSKSARMRRMRRFGFNNLILSNATVYLNPYTESSGGPSSEEAAMFAAVSKFFNNRDS